MRDKSVGLRRSERLRKKLLKEPKEQEKDEIVIKIKDLPPKFAYKRSNIQKETTKKDNKTRKGVRKSKRLRERNSIDTETTTEEPSCFGKFSVFPVFQNESKLNDPDEVLDWSEWVAATGTRNYMMNDGFLDVLKNKSSSVIKADANYSKDIAQVVSSSTNTKGFVSSLMQQGNIFESKVISLLQREVGLKNTVDIGGNHNARSKDKYLKTIEAIQRGIPLIFQGILRNYENKTYGVADILIRSDWINSFLDVNALSTDDLRVPAPKLNKKYHYVVIDIKYKTLPLRADGIHLRNDANLKAYKSQLCIYNEALSQIQGILPPYAFILGSKWKYTSKNRTFEGHSCFERLGKIDFLDLDSSYVEKTRLAVEWLKDVREQEYDLSAYPLARDELYPNMCNRHDYPYHNIKKKYADQNKDLTLLWNVGPKERRIANDNGVYSWDDPDCSPETLGVKGPVKSRVLRRILEANHSQTKMIFPKYIQNNHEDWKNLDGKKLELFVDFETTCSVFNDMDDLTDNTNTSLIFLIGAGYIHPITQEWIFVKFVANQITEGEENRICEDFFKFIKILEYEFEIADGIQCWHYSHAEPSSWRRCDERNKAGRMVEWADLLKVILGEPIGIKGCLSYGLKTVAKNFYSHGFIQTTWPENTNCSDGADAAVGAYRANLECLKNGTSFPEHSLTQEIIKYNEVDCKVLQEIITYLRDNHVDYSAVEDIDSSSVEEVPEPRKKRQKR